MWIDDIDWDHVVSVKDGNKVLKKLSVDGNEVWRLPQYIPFTPPDEETFPTTLNGFYAEALEGNAVGASASYHGSVYAKPWISQPAKKLGKIYSSWGNGVDNFSVFQYGCLAIGYSADSASSGTQALNVWWQDLTTGKANVSQVNSEIDEAGITILYELFTSDGSVWKAKQRTADGAYGYLNEATNVFVEVKNMDAVSNNLLMGGNPFGGDDEE